MKVKQPRIDGYGDIELTVFDGGWDDSKPSWVFGWQFGPVFIAYRCGLEEACDEWDEQHGQRLEDDLQSLADYKGEDDAERLETAMADGDLRCNDGGTMVWVDPYEWCREFSNPALATLFARGKRE